MGAELNSHNFLSAVSLLVHLLDLAANGSASLKNGFQLSIQWVNDHKNLRFISWTTVNTDRKYSTVKCTITFRENTNKIQIYSCISNRLIQPM